MNRTTYSPSGWNNRIRPVSSIEEVKAASIDFDGSVFYFSDLANKRIYTKQIGLDGLAQLNMYELAEIPVTAESRTDFDTSNFVTRNEFEDAINQLKKYLEASASASRIPAAASEPVEPKPVQKSITTERSFDF